MKRSQAFPSKYLSKDDVKWPTVATIAKVMNETLGQGDDQEIKPVMYFSTGVEKPMVINTTNWMSVEDVYGDESDNWVGRSIEIYSDPTVTFGGKRVGGLRLRAPSVQAVQTAPEPVANSAPAKPKTWSAFLVSIGATDTHVRAALGTGSVKEWLEKNPAKTVKDAAELVKEAMTEFASQPDELSL